MSWIFDVLQILMALCAIPIYLLITAVLFDSSSSERENDAFGVLMLVTVAMGLDFLGSFPGLGVGDKSMFGQDVLEPLSHLAVTGTLVVGLWKSREISTEAVLVLTGLGIIGFVCSTFVADDTLVRELANGLMPAFNWLVMAACVVVLINVAGPKQRDRFNAYLIFGLLALVVMAAQHELIIQWAQGNPHYPQLK